MLLNKNGRVPTLVEKLAYAAPDLTLSLLRRSLQRAAESPDKTADLVKFACALATQGTTLKNVRVADRVLRLVMEPGLQTPGVGETLYDAVATVAKNMVRLAPGTNAGLQLADQFLKQCVAKTPPGSSQQPDGTPLRPGDVLLPNLAYGTAMFVALATGKSGGADAAYRWFDKALADTRWRAMDVTLYSFVHGMALALPRKTGAGFRFVTRTINQAMETDNRGRLRDAVQTGLDLLDGIAWTPAGREAAMPFVEGPLFAGAARLASALRAQPDEKAAREKVARAAVALIPGDGANSPIPFPGLPLARSVLHYAPDLFPQAFGGTLSGCELTVLSHDGLEACVENLSQRLALAQEAERELPDARMPDGRTFPQAVAKMGLGLAVTFGAIAPDISASLVSTYAPYAGDDDTLLDLAGRASDSIQSCLEEGPPRRAFLTRVLRQCGVTAMPPDDFVCDRFALVANLPAAPIENPPSFADAVKAARRAQAAGPRSP